MPVRTVAIYIAAAVMLFFTACSSPFSRKLDQADDLMETRPDSALMILDSIPGASLTTEALRARHALLLTQAMVKCDVPIPSDSLISTAEAYYKNHRDFNNLRALFYLGWVRWSLNDNSRAVIPALKAYDLAVVHGDPLWTAKTAELLSFIYSSSYTYDEAIEMATIASGDYMKAGLVKNGNYCLVDVAADFVTIQEYEKADSLLDSIISKHERAMEDSALVAYAYRTLFQSRFWEAKAMKKSYARAKEALQNLEGYDQYIVREPSLEIMMSLVQGDGRPIQCTDSIQRGEVGTGSDDQQANSITLLTLIASAEAVGNWKQAYELTDSLREIEGEIFKDAIQHTVQNEQKTYLDREIVREKKLHRKKLWWSVSISILLVVILSVAVYIMRLRMKLRSEQFDQQVTDLLRLTDTLRGENEVLLDKNDSLQQLSSQTTNENRRLEKEIEEQLCQEKDMNESINKLFSGQWEILNGLCRDYLLCAGSKKMQTLLLKNIETEIKRIATPKELNKLAASVNKYKDNVLYAFEELFPKAKAEDLGVFTLLYAGMLPKTVAVVLDIPVKTIYNKRLRVLAKLKEMGIDQDNMLIRGLLKP